MYNIIIGVLLIGEIIFIIISSIKSIKNKNFFATKPLSFFIIIYLILIFLYLLAIYYNFNDLNNQEFLNEFPINTQLIYLLKSTLCIAIFDIESDLINGIIDNNIHYLISFYLTGAIIIFSVYVSLFNKFFLALINRIKVRYCLRHDCDILIGDSEYNEIYFKSNPKRCIILLNSNEFESYNKYYKKRIPVLKLEFSSKELFKYFRKYIRKFNDKEIQIHFISFQDSKQNLKFIDEFKKLVDKRFKFKTVNNVIFESISKIINSNGNDNLKLEYIKDIIKSRSFSDVNDTLNNFYLTYKNKDIKKGEEINIDLINYILFNLNTIIFDDKKHNLDSKLISKIISANSKKAIDELMKESYTYNILISSIEKELVSKKDIDQKIIKIEELLAIKVSKDGFLYDDENAIIIHNDFIIINDLIKIVSSWLSDKQKTHYLKRLILADTRLDIDKILNEYEKENFDYTRYYKLTIESIMNVITKILSLDGHVDLKYNYIKKVLDKYKEAEVNEDIKYLNEITVLLKEFNIEYLKDFTDSATKKFRIDYINKINLFKGNDRLKLDYIKKIVYSNSEEDVKKISKIVEDKFKKIKLSVKEIVKYNFDIEFKDNYLETINKSIQKDSTLILINKINKKFLGSLKRIISSNICLDKQIECINDIINFYSDNDKLSLNYCAEQLNKILFRYRNHNFKTYKQDKNKRLKVRKIYEIITLKYEFKEIVNCILRVINNEISFDETSKFIDEFKIKNNKSVNKVKNEISKINKINSLNLLKAKNILKIVNDFEYNNDKSLLILERSKLFIDNISNIFSLTKNELLRYAYINKILNLDFFDDVNNTYLKIEELNNYILILINAILKYSNVELDKFKIISEIINLKMEKDFKEEIENLINEKYGMNLIVNSNDKKIGKLALSKYTLPKIKDSRIFFIHVEIDFDNQQTIRNNLLSSKANQNEKNCIAAFIDCFNRHDLISLNFIENHPITRFLPQEFIDYETATIKNDKQINVMYIGFGKVAKALYRSQLMNDQLVTIKKTSDGSRHIESFKINYYAFDHQVDGLNNKNNSFYSDRYDNNINKYTTDEYFDSIPKLNNLKYFPLELDSNEVFLKINKILFNNEDNNTFNRIIVSFKDDIDNIDYALKLKELFYKNGYNENSDRYEIFVRIRDSDSVNIVNKLLGDKHIKIFGNISNIFNHDIIVKEKQMNIAKLINSEYKKGKGLYATGWYELPYIKQFSNLYASINLRLKLNLLGYDYKITNYLIDNNNCIDKLNEILSFNSSINDYKDYLFFKNIKPNTRLLAIHLLAYQEKLRWNAFYLMHGYVPMKINSIEVRNINGKLKQKKDDDDLCVHGCITTYEGLDKYHMLLAILTCNHNDKSIEYNLNDVHTYKYDYMLINKFNDIFSNEKLSNEYYQLIKINDLIKK